jgi:glycosyltransferase involved in cell wall biosynthesis
MAAGAPVVASRVDGLAEVVGDAGILVPPGDPAALASAIRAVLADPGLRARLSATGRERAAGFSLERWIEEIRGVWARARAGLDQPTSSG